MSNLHKPKLFKNTSNLKLENFLGCFFFFNEGIVPALFAFHQQLCQFAFGISKSHYSSSHAQRNESKSSFKAE